MEKQILLVKTTNNDLWLGKSWLSMSNDTFLSFPLIDHGFIRLDDARQILVAEVGGGTTGIAGIAMYGFGPNKRTLASCTVTSVLIKAAVILECKDAVYKEAIVLPVCTADEHRRLVRYANEHHCTL